MNLIRKASLIGSALVFLASCGEREVILPGERLDIGAISGTEQPLQANQTTQIRLAAQVNHTAWTHRAGAPSHTIQHAAFASAPALSWAADIGQGNDRRHRITADPVAADGRIFTLDSRVTVTATSSGGATLWSRDLTPASENQDDASSGGLAIAGRQLFVTTGFGELIALDVETGVPNWRQRLEAPAAGSPTVIDGVVYLATRDSRAWALDASDGRIRWQLQGAPSPNGVVGGAGPAVNNRIAVFPFGSAQILGAFRKGGFQIWTASAGGGRSSEVYANVTDITGDPVLVGNVIYVGNPSGRTVAIAADSGDRLWTAREGSASAVTVAGGSVFLVSDQAQLIRLDARSGAHIWAVDLPGLVPQRRAKKIGKIFANFGPVLAGGRLWVASSDGQLRGFDPVSGALQSSLQLGAGASSRPIVVGGTMYIVSENGQLLAFR